jgi:hypothetical protein
MRLLCTELPRSDDIQRGQVGQQDHYTALLDLIVAVSRTELC